MSVTVVALPIALAQIVAPLVAGTVVGLGAEIANSIHEKNKKNIKEQILNFSNNIQLNCNDVEIVDNTHFIEHSFETAFVDKDILLKTLEEHGLNNLQESGNKVTGSVNNFILEFEKKEEDKPYTLNVKCTSAETPEEKINDISSEYAINVQESAYLNIVENLKNNNMEIEEEEVLEDNTIVLTINVE